MTHEDALNQILANACPRAADDESNSGFREYHLELHCKKITVIAKPLGNLQYEIQEIKVD